MEYIEGGVTAAKGFKASSAAAGIKYQGRTDMAMIYSDVPCVAAGTFTTNIVKAAPVKWDRQVVYESEHAQAVICNSGNANTCNANGVEVAEKMCDILADELKINANDVVVVETGYTSLGNRFRETQYDDDGNRISETLFDYLDRERKLTIFNADGTVKECVEYEY